MYGREQLEREWRMLLGLKNKKLWGFLLIILNILIIGYFLISFLNRTYPMIGHDYRLFMPYMIDSYLHQKINGLIVQWYTPSFVGGRPVYPNPQDLQYSLPQLLLWVFNPWTAILASMMVFITIGFVATWYFLKRLVGLGNFASILGAIFFIANGFYFEHMAAGHITFQAFPLFAVIAILLTHPRLPTWLGGLLLSLIITILLYSGIHNIPFFLLTGILFFPLLYLIRPDLIDLKRIFSIALWGAIAAALVCGSKISAIIYFMRFFPRYIQDNYATTLLTGMVGMVQQLLGTMTLAPIYHLLQGKYTIDWILALSKATGTKYGYWELDASLSPALLLLLAGGACAFLFRKPNLKAPIHKKRLAAIACLVLATWLVIEFTLAKGFIYPLLRNLPILKSLDVNIRYTCAFIFPLAVVGAVIFDNWTRNWKSSYRRLAIFLLLDGLALGCLWFYRYVPVQYEEGAPLYQLDGFDYQPILDTYDQIRYAGATFPVTTVIPDIDNWYVIQAGATNLNDQDNIYFKDLPGYSQALHYGSVYKIDDGYYNMIDPTGYLFPEVNHSTMFERIPVADKAKLDAFVNRRQPDWKLPILQQVLDWVSLISLIGVFVLLAFYLIRSLIFSPNRNHVHHPG
jgi:hypothetical protein